MCSLAQLAGARPLANPANCKLAFARAKEHLVQFALGGGLPPAVVPCRLASGLCRCPRVRSPFACCARPMRRRACSLPAVPGRVVQPAPFPFGVCVAGGCAPLASFPLRSRVSRFCPCAPARLTAAGLRPLGARSLRGGRSRRRPPCRPAAALLWPPVPRPFPLSAVRAASPSRPGAPPGAAAPLPARRAAVPRRVPRARRPL